MNFKKNLLLCVIFALLDPDPDLLTRLNPDPIRIRNPAFSSTLLRRLVSSAASANGWPVRLAWIRIRFATPEKQILIIQRIFFF
jgi:hypothetical protein